MDLMVIPNIENAYKKQRAKDELPQSSSGKSIHTTEPKFIPNEAIEIKLFEIKLQLPGSNKTLNLENVRFKELKSIKIKFEEIKRTTNQR